MRIKKIIRLYENGNVMLQGKKGRGKDLLTANIVIRRKKPYVSNINYGGKFIMLDLSKLDINNNYINFISNNIKNYTYPYPSGTDIYISDIGVYFPSQYNGQLNNRFQNFPSLFALIRQIGDNSNIHCNAQVINRVWDKVREQSDTYITTLGCKVLFKGKIVIQKIRLHEKYESALTNCPPFRMRVPLFNKDRIQQVKIERERYYCTNGKIKDCILIYRNKSKYDDKFFGTMLRGSSYTPFTKLDFGGNNEKIS